MGRLLFIILFVSYILVLDVVFGFGLVGTYKKRKMSVKSRVMTNVSVGVYRTLQSFMPFELIQNASEFQKINPGIW